MDDCGAILKLVLPKLQCRNDIDGVLFIFLDNGEGHLFVVHKTDCLKLWQQLSRYVNDPDLRFNCDDACEVYDAFVKYTRPQ